MVREGTLRDVIQKSQKAIADALAELNPIKKDITSIKEHLSQLESKYSDNKQWYDKTIVTMDALLAWLDQQKASSALGQTARLSAAAPSSGKKTSRSSPASRGNVRTK